MDSEQSGHLISKMGLQRKTLSIGDFRALMRAVWESIANEVHGPSMWRSQYPRRLWSTGFSRAADTEIGIQTRPIPELPQTWPRMLATVDPMLERLSIMGLAFVFEATDFVGAVYPVRHLSPGGLGG